MKPDRIVIGADDERAIAALRTVYAPFMRNHERLLVMDVRSAELTKYAANAMLATRISFMNEVANLADQLGADIEMVRQGIGSDPRIGYHFLYPGAGYGGSCFPKDVKALQFTATQLGRPLRVIAAVEAVNDAQKLVLVEKIVGRFGEDLSGRRFALWGLAFKPNTDDMREAPSRTIIEALLRARRDRRRVRSGGDGRGAPRVRAARRACPMRRRRWRRATAPTRWSSSPNGRNSAAPISTRSSPGSSRRSSSTAATCTIRAQVRAAGFEYFGHRPALKDRIDMTDARFSTYRDRAARARLLVVGDVMLDRYWFGDVERISPEAPVPVVKIARTEERPGGAANVARNAVALGAAATLLSVIGDDEPGATLERLLAGERVRTSFHRDASLPTTVKLRVIGRQQQLLRIDFETAPSHEVLATKLADYERQLQEADLVILSDYGKGGLAHIATMIERARAAGKPVLVDPKGEDYARYRGATLHHAQPQRIPAGRRALEGRRGNGREGARRCAATSGSMRCSSRARRRG